MNDDTRLPFYEYLQIAGMRLFDKLPGLTVAECDEIARGLRRAWPKLQPEEAWIST